MPRFIPKPSGEHCVGFTDVISERGQNRLFYRLFYPVAPHTPDLSTAPAFSEDREYVRGFAGFFGVPWLSWLVGWFTCALRLPLAKDRAPQFASGKLPVAVFSHGLGGNRLVYSNVCSDLASRGVLVALLEHADRSASATYYLDERPGAADDERVWLPYLHGVAGSTDEFEVRNRQVHRRAEECCRMLSQLEDLNNGTLKVARAGVDLAAFEGKLDLDRCGVAGHSFGGSTALTALAKDHRFRVAVTLDAWMFPLDKDVYRRVGPVPILFVNTETFNWKSNVANIRKLDADTCAAPVERTMLTTRGTVHQSQSDSPFLLPLTGVAKTMRLCGPIDPVRACEFNNRLLAAFFGKHLGLSFGEDVAEVVEENADLAFMGTNIEVDEEMVKESKTKLNANYAASL